MLIQFRASTRSPHDSVLSQLQAPTLTDESFENGSRSGVRNRVSIAESTYTLVLLSKYFAAAVGAFFIFIQFFAFEFCAATALLVMCVLIGIFEFFRPSMSGALNAKWIKLLKSMLILLAFCMAFILSFLAVIFFGK